MNVISIPFCCQAIFLRVAFIYWLKCLLMGKISRRHFIPFSWFDNQKGTPWEAHQGDFSLSRLVFNIESKDARFYRYDIGFLLTKHIADSETLLHFNWLQLQLTWLRFFSLFMCTYDMKQDECCVRDTLNSFLWQVWLRDVSYGAIYVNCLDLISQNFQYPVFLKLFFRRILCWISATYCFSWIMIIWIAFEPLLVVQTACIICYGKTYNLRQGNLRRRLSSLFEMYARKAWSLYYTASNICYGIELSGAFLLPVLPNLITCLLVYSSMFGGSYFPQLAQLAFTFFIENY